MAVQAAIVTRERGRESERKASAIFHTSHTEMGSRVEGQGGRRVTEEEKEERGRCVKEESRCLCMGGRTSPCIPRILPLP